MPHCVGAMREQEHPIWGAPFHLQSIVSELSAPAASTASKPEVESKQKWKPGLGGPGWYEKAEQASYGKQVSK